MPRRLRPGQLWTIEGDLPGLGITSHSITLPASDRLSLPGVLSPISLPCTRGSRPETIEKQVFSGLSMKTEEDDAIIGSGSPKQTHGRSMLSVWWLIALIGLVMAVSTGLVSDSMAYYFLVLWEEFGWTPVELSLTTLIFTIAGILLAPVVGLLGDRVVGIPRMVTAGLIVLAAAFFFFSRTQELWMALATVALMGVGATMSGWVLLLTAVSRWFVRRRATAIGMVYMLGSLGSLIFVPLFFVGIADQGWQLTAAATGGFILAVAALVFVLLRSRTGERGTPSFSAFQTLRTRAFWLVALGDGLAAMEILRLGDFANLGFASSLLARVTTTSVITSFVFYPVGGLVGDRFSKSTALACFTALQVVAWVAMAVVGSLPALYVAAVALGISKGGRTPLRVAILADYFGTASLAFILGLFAFFSGLLTFVGQIAGGVLYDTQGGAVGFMILAAISLVSTFCFLKARQPQLPQATEPQAGLG